MQLQISKNTNLLLESAEEWDFQNPPLDIVEFSQALVDLMLEKNGFGLAANQCGYPYAIFAMRGSPENFVIINPYVVSMSVEKNIELEGCLSFPGLGIQRERSNEIKIRFSGPNGETYTKIFKNLTARVIQHELFHLNGIPWWSGISKIKFNMAVKKAYKRGYDYRNLTFKGV